MEHPRPQPHASYTLIYFLLIAALSQVIGESLRPNYATRIIEEGAQEPIEDPSLLSKSSRLLRWTPAEASAFLPKIFRESEEHEPQLIVEEINDDLLISDLATEVNFSAKMIEEDIEIKEGQPNKIEEGQPNKIEEGQPNKIEEGQPNKIEEGQPKKRNEAQSNEAQSNEQSPKKWNKSKVTKSKKSAKQIYPALAILQSETTINPQKTMNLKEVLSPKGESKTKPTFQKVEIKNKQGSKQKSSKLVKLDQPQNKPKRRKRRKRRYSKSGVLIYGIEDEDQALKSFYQKLGQIKTKGNKVRVVHYGDSLIAGDYVTRTVRRLLQKTFGDGGHGYFLAGKGSRWYGRRWIELKSRGKWKKKRFTRAKNEVANYGLGGVSFTSASKGAWVKAKPTGTRLGSRVDFIEVHYLAQPNGGSFTVEFGDQNHEVKTHAESVQVKKLVLKATKSGSWKTKVQVIGDGEVTLFGLVFERKRGGVVYDSLGLEGARAKLLLNMMSSSWTQQLRQRQPDLYILHYGTNESVNARMSMNKYKVGLRKVIKRFKKALPKASCMLMSPMDRGEKNPETGQIKSMRIVSRIVRAQREVSAEEKCAFWSAYDAMGGRGSMGRWYKASPKLAGGDLTHPTGSGANRIGAMFFAALMDGYQRR
jgi:lysophospholipase L1-like esterase